MSLPCGHEQQTIEGVALPCADWRCEGSPGGDRYKVSVAIAWNKGRSLLFSRQGNPWGHDIKWRLDEARDIDLETIDNEARARVLAFFSDGGTALAMVAELEGTLRGLWDQVKDQPWDDTRKSVEKTLAGARELLERMR